MAYARKLSTSEDFETTLSSAKEGAEWAWAEIYRDLAGVVTGYLNSRGAGSPEDLCSETFLHVARNIDEFEGDYDSFRSWVFVIAHRRLIDARRYSSRRPKLVADDERLGRESTGIGADEEAIAALGDHQALEILSQLTNDQRDVLALRVIADLSVKQTAAVLGKKPGAIKALQRRAITSLHRILAERGVSP